MNKVEPINLPILLNQANEPESRVPLALTSKTNEEKVKEHMKRHVPENHILDSLLTLTVAEYLFSAFSNMDIGVIFINVHNEVQYLNHRAQNICKFHYRNDQKYISVAKISQLSGIDLQKNIQKLRSTSHRGLKTMIRNNQTNEIFNLQIAKIKNNSSEVLGYICLVQNLTKELTISNKKSEFISMVAHELLNPLAAIQEGVALLTSEGNTRFEENQKKCLSIISEETQRLKNLVVDILDINRYDMGKIRLTRTKITIHKLIFEVIELVRKKYEFKNIAVQTKISENITDFYTDAERLKQILINLLDNAFKYSPKETTISIQVTSSKAHVIIRVNDQGYGIKKEDLKLIFERFTQLDYPEHAPNQHGGNGLGLSIVKEIVKALQGKIIVRSEYQVGSEFTVFLPKRKKERNNETLQSAYCR